jgi:hypothetical protein
MTTPFTSRSFYAEKMEHIISRQQQGKCIAAGIKNFPYYLPNTGAAGN